MEAKYPKDSPHTAKHSKRSYTAYSLLKITFLVLFFINTSNVSAQWNNYQVFESFGTSIPTSGGTWTDNSVTYATVAQAWSGGNQLEMDAAGDYIQTPLISTPAKFTFYYKRSGGVGPGAPKFSVYTSPDGTTWTYRAATGTFITNFKPFSLDLALLGLTNVYVRIIDETPTTDYFRYIDDIAWTSTVTSENTFIPLSWPGATYTNNKTIDCGTTYTFTDQGGINDTYNTSKNHTITFLPSVGTNKVELTFNAFNLEAGNDGMTIYDGLDATSPMISSGLPAGTTPANCPAGSFYGTTSPGTITSTDASGAITVVFKSNTIPNNSGWIAGVTCNPPTACQKPTITPTTAITASTATINWTAPSPAPSSGYEYVVSTNNITPSGPGTFVAGLSANISSLAANTVYYVFVRSDCGSGDFSTWTPSGNFTTAFGPCIAPVSQANTYVAGAATSTTFTGSFSGIASGYLVVQSTSATPPTQPVNGTTYTSGNITSLGAGLTFVQTAATTSFTATTLIGNTAYYYYIFAYNDASCIGGPTYNTAGPLVGTGTTCPAVPNTVGTASVTSGGFTINWTAPTGGTAAALTYSVQVTTDAAYLTGWIAGSPFAVVAPTTTLAVSGLNSNTLYYYRILASNGCSSAYVTGSQLTLLPNCVAPVNQASAFVLGTPTSSSLPASFSGTASGYLVVRSLTSVAPAQPTNGTVYNAGNVASLGAAFTFVQSGASTTIAGTGLAVNTQYYYFIFAYNDTSCLGGPTYKTLGPLTGNGTTLNGFNDECTTAFPLTVSSVCTYATYTNAGATASSGVPAPGCASYSGGDVWFKVIVPATGILNVDTQTGVITDSGMALYSGTCGALTLIECDDDDSDNGLMSYISRSGLTPGSTIYIRVWEYGNNNNGTFGICVSSPTCIAPTLIPVTNITLTSATITWTPPTSIPSVGYEYVVSTSNTTPVVAGTATTATTVNLTGLTPNTTYYVYVRSSCGAGDFSPWTPYEIFSTGYCSASSTSSTYYISNFSTTGGITNISNASGYSASGYGNYTAQTVSQMNYNFVNFSVNFFNGTYTYGFKIWVDWNNDFDFNDAGELVYASGTYVSSATGTFTVPDFASLGAHRMRIRANYTSSNPDACGVSGNGETEDYTFFVSNPPPCANNPYDVTAVATSQTTATVSWLAPTPAPANGYQYYLSTSNSTPSLSATPTGSTAAGITTLNLTGLTPGSSYSIWIRSNCGGATGQGVWVGPTNFREPNCAIGNGTGTTTLPCPSLISGGLGLSGSNPAPVNSCTASSCVDLEANYSAIKQTTSYTVESIPYAPPYQFSCLYNPVSVNVDDVWSPTINLPFNFCFYGNNYNKCLIGSNGVITFDTVNNLPEDYSAWSFSNGLPNSNLFLNTIFGVYHDIDPSKGGEVGWELITLNTGCRALVASWKNIPMYSSSCNSQLYTGMIVLYENTNIIDVYIQEKNACSSWNGGNAIVGLQNNTGTQGIVAPNRNALDPDWTVNMEAWRFSPAGATIASVKWYEGVGTTGPEVGNTDVIQVCPALTTTYTAEVSYDLCGGRSLKKTAQTTVTVTGNKVWNGSIDTDWKISSNWTPPVIPNASDCVVIPNTIIDPIVSSTGDAYAFNLTVLNGGNLQVNSGTNITVTNQVNVDTGGQFNISNSGSLIQINNVANTGKIDVERITQPMYRFDFTFWGTPVTFASNFTLGNLTPLTLSDKYFSWIPTVANGFGNWMNESTATVMNPIKGYITRAPQTFSFTPTPGDFLNYTAHFIGTPNNGDISAPIYHGTLGAGTNNDKYNLLGNPYPSAVDAQAFLSYAPNKLVIDGTIYFWTHNSAPSTAYVSPFYQDFIINYTDSDYASWNSLGAVGSRGSAAISGGFVPNGLIATGQGFFTKSTGTAPTGDNVIFKNTMRVSDSNAHFFRTSTNGGNNRTNDVDRHRIWLNLITQSGIFNQILVGYIDGATEGWDRDYDGVRFTDNSSATFYSVIPQRDLVIQGRPTPFTNQDKVPLGFTATVQDHFSLFIDHFDGLFENQNVYVEDTYLNIIHDLKQSPYVFNSEIGTFNDRLILRYTDTATLSTNTFNNNQNVIALIYHKNLVVEASQNIKEVMVYDISGKLINTYIPKNKTMKMSENFMYAEGVYLLKIKLENDTIVAKKLIHKMNE